MKTVTIEELLVWAFVHELPKGGGTDGLDSIHSAWRQLEASSWGKVLGYAELMTLVDRDRADPGTWIEQGAPHEDALEVGRAVAQLAKYDVMFPEGWNPVIDWTEQGELTRDAISRAVERFSLRPASKRGASIVSLVISTAILGRLPDFYAPEPEQAMIERNGKPAWFMRRTAKDAFGREYSLEVDGYNHRAKRPQRDAYVKYEFQPEPLSDILGRVDYQIWIAALLVLESALAKSLTSHRLTYSALSATPWLEEKDMLGVQLFRAFEGVSAQHFEKAC
ncbi:hypothetical protein U2P60_01030 [Brucella sp. H1_1004]|uniref:hypothetical protein n=1 Tax=Brucella sp. H1_1004 TaxID=3110109 RepID=UPI0039B59BC9